jgi:Trk K+ transport system NAD-binding subunit
MQIKVTTESLDRLQHECLVLGFFSDERPPRGNGGFVDWRLNGLVSRLIAEGRIRGEFSERVLIGPQRRIPPRKIVLFGLGRAGISATKPSGTRGRGWRNGVRMHCYDFAVEVPAAGRSLLEVAEMTAHFTTGMFEFLSGDRSTLAAAAPCLLSDESFSRRPAGDPQAAAETSRTVPRSTSASRGRKRPSRSAEPGDGGGRHMKVKQSSGRASSAITSPTILSKEKQDVILIDRNEERLQELARRPSTSRRSTAAAAARGAQEGGPRAGGHGSSPSRTATRLTWCLPLSSPRRSVRVSFKIARIRNPSSTSTPPSSARTTSTSASASIPSARAVKNALDLIEYTGAAEVTDFHDGRIKLIGFSQPEQFRDRGKTLPALREIHPDSKMLITSIIRDESLLEPKGDSVIREGELLLRLCRRGGGEGSCCGLRAEKRSRPGGSSSWRGQHGTMLAEALERKGIAVKIIEKRRDRCHQLAERLDGPSSCTATARARTSSRKRTSGTWTCSPPSPTTRRPTSSGRSSPSAWA